MTATRLVAASRSRAEAGSPVREAQPLRAAPRPSTIDSTCGNNRCQHVPSGQDVGCTRHRSSDRRTVRRHCAARPGPVLRLRPRGRRTSHPVAAHRGWHQNPSYSRSSGSEGRNQSLSRHLAARTYRGSIRNTVTPPNRNLGAQHRRPRNPNIELPRCELVSNALQEPERRQLSYLTY